MCKVFTSSGNYDRKGLIADCFKIYWINPHLPEIVYLHACYQ